MFVCTPQQPKAASSFRPKRSARVGFTLVELLMVIMIIGILSTFVLVALTGANETAKEDRTKAQIKKIHELVMEKWEQYRYRRVPATRTMVMRRQFGMKTVSNTKMGKERVAGLRELLRMEMPSFMSDVMSPAGKLVDPLDAPKYRRPYQSALQRAYQQRATETWTTAHENAECLYLILSQIRDQNSSALEFFRENEIGDVDGDGMNEILDAWGNPIQWLLWAPGHLSPMQVSLSEQPEQDDPFDPSTLGSGYQATNFNGTYTGNGFNIDFSQLPRALYPLINSAGPDGKHGIVLGTNENGVSNQNWLSANNDPYDRDSARQMFLLGATSVANAEALADDISNHYLTTR